MSGMEISIDGMRVAVDSFKDASHIWRLHVTGTGIGASDMKRNDGKIFLGKTKVAHVSYNGRVWDNNDQEIVLSNEKPAVKE